MANQFSVGGNGQKQLKKFFKIAPMAFQRSSAGVLNTLAFTSKKGMPKTLEMDNIIRNPKLMNRLLRVEKAKPTQNISTQQSRVGSVLTKRHDGWKAIDKGTATSATQFTSEGRQGGTDVGKAKKGGKIGSPVTEEKDFSLKGGGNRTVLFLQAIQNDKTRRRKPFFLPRNFKGMKKAVYKFKGGKVGTLTIGKRKFKKTLVGAKIVKISDRGADFKPKKTDWNARTIKREIKERVVRKAWIRNQEFELKRVINKLK